MLHFVLESVIVCIQLFTFCMITWPCVNCVQPTLCVGGMRRRNCTAKLWRLYIKDTRILIHEVRKKCFSMNKWVCMVVYTSVFVSFLCHGFHTHDKRSPSKTLTVHDSNIKAACIPHLSLPAAFYSHISFLAIMACWGTLDYHLAKTTVSKLLQLINY